jgi:hypothetical protein
MGVKERNAEGHPAAYLGDGAYVSFDGLAVNVYTSNGVSVDNRVVLEPHGVSELLRFLVELGIESKFLVKP